MVKKIFIDEFDNDEEIMWDIKERLEDLIDKCQNIHYLDRKVIADIMDSWLIKEYNI